MRKYNEIQLINQFITVINSKQSCSTCCKKVEIEQTLTCRIDFQLQEQARQAKYDYVAMANKKALMDQVTQQSVEKKSGTKTYPS